MARSETWLALYQTINKILSVPEQAIYLLNVVFSGTSNEPKRVSSGKYNVCSGKNNKKNHRYLTLQGFRSYVFLLKFLHIKGVNLAVHFFFFLLFFKLD